MKKLPSNAWKIVRSAVNSTRAWRYRTYLFQSYILGALLLFILLALLANTNAYQSFDLEATRELQSGLPQWTAGIMIALSWPGWTVQAIGVVFISVIVLLLFGLRREAVSAAFAAINSMALNYLVKVVIRRPRPSETLVDVFEKLNGYSFPSGHVMFYVGFFGFLLFLALIMCRNLTHRLAVVLFLLVLIIGVGFSRVYLGEHWASDVIGGYLLGSLNLILSIQLYRYGKGRLMPGQSVALEAGEGSDSAADETNRRI